jgi:TRAP-type mannitol/chloroaromatic compound transport system permease small subunit
MDLLLRRILPALDRVSAALAVLAQAMIVVLICVMLYEVAARRLFNSPTLWSVDIVYMVNGTLFLISAGYTLLKERHVRIDFLSSRLPARVQHAVNALFYALLFLPLLALTTSASLDKAWEAFVEKTLENMSVWQPVIWPFLTGIALGLLGLALQVTLQTIRHAIGVFRPEAVPLPGHAAGPEL